MRHKIVYLALCAMLLAFCLPARAQQPKKIPRIGYLTAASLSGIPHRIEAFRQGLRELGYMEGKNIVIEWRYVERKLDRLSALAAELVRLKVAVIVTSGPASTRAAKEATPTIPIVMARAVYASHRKQVTDIALKNRLRTIFRNSKYVEDGGLISYGVNLIDLDRRAATYVDKILKGTKPADLPVEQPGKFEPFINLKSGEANRPHGSAECFR